MDGMWKRTFDMYSKTDEYSEKVELARFIISKALRNYKKPYIAFSGGKDSICMTHLIMQQDDSVLVYHHDQGKYMPDGIRKELRDILNALQVKNLDLRLPEEDFWNGILKEYIALGYDVSFIGLRKEESVGRRLRIKAKRYLTPIPEVWPLQDWTWLDVWAYIVSHNIPYPSSYNRYGPLQGWDKVRFHSFFDPSMNKFGCSNVDGVLSWKFRNSGS